MVERRGMGRGCIDLEDGGGSKGDCEAGTCSLADLLDPGEREGRAGCKSGGISVTKERRLLA